MFEYQIRWRRCCRKCNRWQDRPTVRMPPPPRAGLPAGAALPACCRIRWRKSVKRRQNAGAEGQAFELGAAQCRTQ